MNRMLRTHIIESLEKGARLDGRKPLDIREVSVTYGVSKNAEGSAKVTIGETEVLAGVKMALESPYPDSPDQGNLMVNAELIPLANPEFELGPPDIRSIEIARVIDRGIRESKSIDVKKLCISAGEKVWSVIIDIIPINDAGNLLDAGALAAVAALHDAKFPKVSKDFVIDYHEHTKDKLALKEEPIAVTVYKIGDHYIIDPTIEEEKAYDARLTVTTSKDGTICAMQKGGDEALTTDEISTMIDIAQKKEKELRAKLR